MIYYRKLLTFHRNQWELLKGEKTQRVSVTWPKQFLSSFCAAFNVPIEGQWPRTPPAKIDPSVLLKLHVGLNILSIKVESSGCVEITVKGDMQDKKKLEKDLERSFGNLISVSLSASK